MKNKFIFLFIVFFMMSVPVEAMGTAKIEFLSEDEIKVGDIFTVDMQLSEIQDTYRGVVSLEGRLSFNSEMLELLSFEGIKEPYRFQMNQKTRKLAALDFTLQNGITDTLTVYQFTFQAKKIGTTVITLNEAKTTDCKEYIDTTVIEKKIQIQEEKEIPKESQEILESCEKEVTPKIEEQVFEDTIIKEDSVEKEIKHQEEKEDDSKEIVENDQVEKNLEENLIRSKPLKEVKVSETKKKKESFFLEKVQKLLSDIFSGIQDLLK